MADCLFCKIIEGKIPARILGESETAVAIADISPQAPFHALVLPRKHVASLNELDHESRRQILPDLYALADAMAREKGFREGGYRTVINNGEGAGQTVHHLHMHVLGNGKLRHGFGA